MDEQRQQRVGDSEKAPALGERDQVPAPLGLLGRVGSSGGVEQRELQDALRRLTHHLERDVARSEEHTSELQSQSNLVCRLLLEKKKNIPEVSVSDAIMCVC